MANSFLCITCEKWIHGRCAKKKMVTPSMVKDYFCTSCKSKINGKVERTEKLFKKVQTVNGFLLFGKQLHKKF